MTHAEEIILLRVLAFKHGTNDDSSLVDNVVDQDPRFKNVCAKLHQPLADKLDTVCGLLSMSKREFITLALTELIDKYENTASQYDMFEPHELQQEGGKTNV